MGTTFAVYPNHDPTPVRGRLTLVSQYKSTVAHVSFSRICKLKKKAAAAAHRPNNTFATLRRIVPQLLPRRSDFGTPKIPSWLIGTLSFSSRENPMGLTRCSVARLFLKAELCVGGCAYPTRTKLYSSYLIYATRKNEITINCDLC